MPSHKKTWILVQGCKYAPGGSISLGQILVEPFEPSLPLLPDGPLKIPETSIERTYQKSVEDSSHHSLSGSFQIWASASHRASNSTTWHFDRLDSEIMVPRLADIQAAIARNEVVAQINRRKFNFKQRLYMITGVRVARGARLLQKSTSSTSASANFGVDLAALPLAHVTFGATTDMKNSEDHSFNYSSAFVYAYRVCEVHYGKDVYVKAFDKGETFSVHKSAERDESSDDQAGEEQTKALQRIVVDCIAGEDYAGAGVPRESFRLVGSINFMDREEDLILARK